MYATLCPDKDCAHAIVLAGIEEVVYRKNDDKQLEAAKKALGNKLR